MKLVKADISKLKFNKYLKSFNRCLLEEFINSGEACMEVVDYSNTSAGSCVWSLNSSIRRFSFGGIKAIQRNYRVYLVRLDALEQPVKTLNKK